MDIKDVVIIVNILRQKLGVVESIDELLVTYRADECEMNHFDPRKPLPEPARWHFYPWIDVLCSMMEYPDDVSVIEEKCPVCGHELLRITFSSPRWTWNELCGRFGLMTLCPNCPKQVDFSLEIMN